MSGESTDDRRPIPRWVGAAALAAGLLLNEPLLERTVVPDGEIGSPALRVLLLVLQAAAAGFGLWVLLRRPESRIPWNELTLAASSVVVAWFLGFTALDTLAPELLGGTGIRYFELRARYVADPDLVMVPRRTGHEERREFRGDLHHPDDDLPDPAVDYRATYNELGFRTNSAEPPYRVAALGDSFVEFGESDSTTVSEMLTRRIGLPTFNLGRGWYGPHQYAEVLRRHGPELDPDFAVLFFFEGNDAEDALEYERWKKGGSYHHFSRVQGPLWERFATATVDLLSHLQWETARRLGLRRRLADALGHDEPVVARNTGRVEVGGETLRMKFGYWPRPPEAGADALLDTPRWRAVRRALRRFRDTATAIGARPAAVFVPTKATTYAGEIVEGPPRYRGRGPTGQGDGGPARAAALASVTEELEIALLDLTADFRMRADEKPLLDYPQDTHWTPRGRRIAAKTLADFLRER
ncbi:MAG: alginate O-acetyltransferase AlgX-related protein, partial [Gemmatimonadota bacterium]